MHMTAYAPGCICTWLCSSAHLCESPKLDYQPIARLSFYNTQPKHTTFKDDYDFESRKAEADRIRQKYSGRIPVICEKADKTSIAEIDKRKYLVPSDLSVGQFVYVVRKRIKLDPEEAIFLFVNDVLPPTSALLGTIYDEHQDKDGFLYITYSGENTFGA